MKSFEMHGGPSGILHRPCPPCRGRFRRPPCFLLSLSLCERRSPSRAKAMKSLPPERHRRRDSRGSANRRFEPASPHRRHRSTARCGAQWTGQLVRNSLATTAIQGLLHRRLPVRLNRTLFYQHVRCVPVMHGGFCMDVETCWDR